MPPRVSVSRAWPVPGLLLVLTMAVGACGSADGTGPASRTGTDPSPWRTQLVEDLVEPWIRSGRDPGTGRFVTHVDRGWSRTGPEETYPSMVGRHLFSLSAAFLATGNGRYLALADSVKAFLVERGWDEARGGWYDRLGPDGEPVDSTKSTFVATYAATGLALHHFVTRDPSSARLVRETNRILETRARDRRRGGYVQALTADLSVADSVKKVASQLAPVSGYLLYHLAATRDPVLLEQSSRLLETVWTRMRDPRSGWIRERFAADWTPLGGDAETYNVGHNVEMAWMLGRVALAASDLPGGDPVAGLPADSALRSARWLMESAAAAAFRHRSGAWIQAVSAPGLEPRRERAVWWIQAYGAMADATLHRITGSATSEDRYRRATRFWNDHLVDRERGGAYLAATVDGRVSEGRKGGRWKTSYHSVEHALWNWWAEALWPGGGSESGSESPGLTLHFRPVAGAAGDTLRPVLIPDPAVRVDRVLQGGEDRSWLVDGGRGVALPADLPAGAVVSVELSAAPESKTEERP